LRNGPDKKAIFANDIALNRMELYLGVPVLFLGLLVGLCWAFPLVIGELREKLYLPYLNGAPIILHIQSGILFLAISPALAMTLPILLLGFLNKGFKIDLSRQKAWLGRFIRIWGYTAIAGLLLAFLVNAYITEQIIAKGYSSCEYLKEFRVGRYATGYVLHPMLCVPEKQRASALENFEQIRRYYPDLLERHRQEPD